ncbi:MAG: sulfatase-like hydrolase/transferase [Chloroflexi bacterium]|nr:sulfatase-like hydrolase/transferase [Chloroflexota bacterium]
MSAAARPNVLVLMSDQHNPMVSSAYGHSFVSTPAIQGLADRGVTFENAYCPSPLCVPSRSAFLTGLPVHQVGAWDNSCPLPVTEPTWAHRLNAVGYETTVCGRMSIGGPNQMHGFAQRIQPEMRPGKMGSSFPDWDAPIRAHRGTRERLETAGAGDTFQQRYDDSVTDAAVAYLSDAARQDGPWAAVVGWFLPHTPLTVRAEYFDMYYPDHVNQPSAAAQPIDTVHPQSRRFREYLGAEGLTDAQIGRARAAYYGMVSFTDAQVGRVLQALAATGAVDNTLVVYTSDHGEMLGEHGLWWKSSFYEPSVRVPLIAAWPGRIEGGSRVDTPVSLLDLTRTIVEAAGAEAEGIVGDDLLESRLDGDRAVFAEFEAHGTDRPARMVRRGRYKLNYYHGEQAELFDLLADPNEFNNLALDSDHREVRDDLVGLVLKDWSPEEIDQRVRESQRRRRILFAGMP